MNGLFSEYGSYPSWSPYTAYKIPQAITFDQGNRFSQNTYEGAWRFMAYTDGTVVPYSLWRTKYHQDLGSNTVRP
ncbi:MAG TPA: hypothetical protein VEH29_03750 [Acidimicrobiales bacterium]|nr:hypothetical protein [Acidimicrobiales bacterium]